MEFFNDWAINIVTAVAIATLVEMILPDNTSKKYIKIVTGVFIVYTIIFPVITKVSNTDITSSFDSNKILQTSSDEYKMNDFSINTSSTIEKIYEENLEKDICSRLNEKGYVPEFVIAKVSSNGSYDIELIKIKIKEKSEELKNKKQVCSIVQTVKIISINISGQEQKNDVVISDSESNNLKDFISATYGVSKEKINVF